MDMFPGIIVLVVKVIAIGLMAIIKQCDVIRFEMIIKGLHFKSNYKLNSCNKCTEFNKL